MSGWVCIPFVYVYPLDKTLKHEFVCGDFDYFLTKHVFVIEKNMILCDIDRKLPLYHNQKGKSYCVRLLHKFETQNLSLCSEC